MKPTVEMIEHTFTAMYVDGASLGDTAKMLAQIAIAGRYEGLKWLLEAAETHGDANWREIVRISMQAEMKAWGQVERDGVLSR